MKARWALSQNTVGDCAHEPDIGTVTTEFDGYRVYVDVNCKRCGRSGCVTVAPIDAGEIEW